MPQGGTAVTVRIGTFRMVPPTLSTLQMYSSSIGDQVTLLSDTGPRGAVIVTARIALQAPSRW